MKKTAEVKRTAKIYGEVKRLANKVSPDRMVISVESFQTTIDGVLFTVSELVTFEVETFMFERNPFMADLCDMAVGDRVTICFTFNGEKWEMSELHVARSIGRTIEDWFKELSSPNRSGLYKPHVSKL